MATKLCLNVVLDVSSFLGCVFKRGKLMLGVQWKCLLAVLVGRFPCL